MNVSPLSISLPKHLLKELNKIAPGRTRSKFITEAISHKINLEKSLSNTSPWERLAQSSKKLKLKQNEFELWLKSRHDGLE